MKTILVPLHGSALAEQVLPKVLHATTTPLVLVRAGAKEAAMG